MKRPQGDDYGERGSDIDHHQFYSGRRWPLIVDRTGLKGLIDTPAQTLDVGPYEITPTAPTVWPDIMNQLGLRMEPARGPAEVLVLDRAERPSEH